MSLGEEIMCESQYLEYVKSNIREEVLIRIKNGEISNGLYPLLSLIDGISYEEAREILLAWKENNFKRLIGVYYIPLLEINLEKIKLMDIEHLETLKNEGKLGR